MHMAKVEKGNAHHKLMAKHIEAALTIARTDLKQKELQGRYLLPA